MHIKVIQDLYSSNSKNIYIIIYFVLFRFPELLNKVNSNPFLRSRLAVADEIL